MVLHWKPLQLALWSILFNPFIIALSIPVKELPPGALPVSPSSTHFSSSEHSLQPKTRAAQPKNLVPRVDDTPDSDIPEFFFDVLTVGIFDPTVGDAAKELASFWRDLTAEANRAPFSPRKYMTAKVGRLVLKITVTKAKSEEDQVVEWEFMETLASFMLEMTEGTYAIFFTGIVETDSKVYQVEFNADPPYELKPVHQDLSRMYNKHDKTELKKKRWM